MSGLQLLLSIVLSYFLCAWFLTIRSLLVSSWVMTSTLSDGCPDTSHGLGPFSPIPSPSHTLPVNHSNFIDITGITDETLSVPQLGVCVSPHSFCLYADVHVHKYTVTPLPTPALFSCLTIISSNQHTGKWNKGRHRGVCMCNWKSAGLWGIPGCRSHIELDVTFLVHFLTKEAKSTRNRLWLHFFIS